jgi:hypothetical protein
MWFYRYSQRSRRAVRATSKCGARHDQQMQRSTGKQSLLQSQPLDDGVQVNRLPAIAEGVTAAQMHMPPGHR